MTLLMMIRQWWEVGGRELGEDGVKIYYELTNIPMKKLLRVSDILDM